MCSPSSQCCKYNASCLLLFFVTPPHFCSPAFDSRVVRAKRKKIKNKSPERILRRTPAMTEGSWKDAGGKEAGGVGEGAAEREAGWSHVSSRGAARCSSLWAAGSGSAGPRRERPPSDQRIGRETQSQGGGLGGRSLPRGRAAE